MNCSGNYLVDVGITLVGNDAFGVIIHFFFAVSNVALNMIHHCFAKAQFLLNLFVTLEQLDSIPTQETAIHIALNAFLNMGDGMLHAAGEDMRQVTALAGFGRRNRHFGGFQRAFPFQRADLNRLAAKLLAQFGKVNLIAVFTHEVDHIHGHHHRDAKFDQLGGQIQVALNVGAVNDVEDCVRLFGNKVFPGNNLFKRIG